MDEVPPDQKPDGDNVAWIPGYWQFEDDRQGLHLDQRLLARHAPGRKWVPGYWNKNDDGRASGWAATGPPRTRGRSNTCPRRRRRRWRTAPSDAAPRAEPCLDSRRVGLADQPLLVAARLLGRAPAGLDLDARLLRLTPVRLRLRGRLLGLVDPPPRRALRPLLLERLELYGRATSTAPRSASTWTSSPTTCSAAPATAATTIGDYYGGSYVTLGFTPWYSFHYARGGGYCPIYAYNSWHYRGNPGGGRAAGRLHYRAQPYRRPATAHLHRQQNVVNINKTVVVNNVTDREPELPPNR